VQEGEKREVEPPLSASNDRWAGITVGRRSLMLSCSAYERQHIGPEAPLAARGERMSEGVGFSGHVREPPTCGWHERSSL
jgi:hypothetical protein